VTSDREELGAPFVVGAGLFLGASMFALSVTGILWRIDALAVSLCLLASLALSVLWIRRSGVRPALSLRAVLLLVPLLVIPAVASLAPPHRLDEVAYGAALPRDYALAGRFFYNADYGPYSAFPANYEALATAALVLVGDVTPARALNALLALGLAVIAVHLSRLLGVPKRLALFAAVLVLSSTALYKVVPMVKNDVANAFFQSLALLAIAAYFTRRQASRLALGAFFLGTAVGTKYSGLQYALCVVPLMAGLILRTSRSWSERTRHLALFGAVALVAALPWYVRNGVVFGNPFFPFLNELFGADNGFTAQHSVLAREIFAGRSGFSWSSGTVGGFAEGLVEGFGWVPVLLCVPGLVAAASRRRDPATVFLGAVVVSYALVTLFAGYWSPRYFLSLLVPASAFATVALAELVRVAPRLPGGLRTAAVGLGVLALVVGGSAIRDQWSRGEKIVKHVLRGERWELVRRNTYWHLAVWCNRNLTDEDRIGFVNTKPYFYLDRPYLDIHPLTEKGNFQALRTPEEHLEAFHEQGLTWLAFQRGNLPRYSEAHAPHLHALRRSFQRAKTALTQSGELTLVKTIGAVRIYRIEPPGSAEGPS
jgi:4-amino-4-deoxy-L-arabinose transferase-like glycosyltransferase